MSQEDANAQNREYCDRLLKVYDYLKIRGKLLYDPLDRGPALSDEPSVNLGRPSPEALMKDPRLQVKFASATAYIPSKWLLEKELECRKNNKDKAPNGGQGYHRPRWKDDKEREALRTAGISAHLEIEQNIVAEVREAQGPQSWNAASSHDVFDAAATQNLQGLCFSGGGIRSATFCLGVLQSLAAAQKLTEFDYLSTVSGGGYIHQWFASWIRRAPAGLAGTKGVQTQLTPLPQPNSLARAPEQISWLRRYSNYLTPKLGFLSADTWTLAATWFRNTFLNQIVLFAFLGLCLLAGRGATRLLMPGYIFFKRLPDPLGLSVYGLALQYLGLVRLFFAIVPLSLLVWAALLSVTKAPSSTGGKWFGALNDGGVVALIVVPGFIFACILARAAIKWTIGDHSWYGSFFALWVTYLLGTLFAITFAVRPAKQPFQVWLFALSAACCAGLSALIWYAFAELACKTQMIRSFMTHSPEPFAVGLPALIFFLQFIAIRLQVGLLGRSYAESRREWLARYGGWAAIVSICWIGLGTIARLSPAFVSLLSIHWQRTVASLAGVAVTHIATLYAGASAKSSGQPKPGGFFGYSALDLLGIVGAPLCILSLLIITSVILFEILHDHSVAYHLGFTVALCATLALFGWRVDVNEFSMHGFYRNRLSRCYLGATNPDRKPDPFTGLDEHESSNNDIRLSDLLPAAFTPIPGMQRDARRYDGPFPIFCCTLNLTFGEDLAAQERKGASFAFTPLYSGYHVGWTSDMRADGKTTYVGYVPTSSYAYPHKGISLATVAAISGAAVNPNMGYNSQPALAFLMTLFNVRLGWWLANTRRPGVWRAENNRPTPLYGIWYLLRELFGLADDTSNYVCLSDGGHFENMGLYELVRRRCKLIVICDAEGDADTVFDGIGGAISKCRTDFGAEITLDLNPIIPATSGDHAGDARTHFQIGTIQYAAPPASVLPFEEFVGKIIYLKTSITGTETADVLSYRRTHPAFPQDSTVNQWFTESQFESYRRLGQLIGAEVCGYI